jgi:hypothetical protein
VRRVRLRPLSEAECYARCYGGSGDDRVVVRVVTRPPARVRVTGEELRELFEARLDAHGPEPETEAA